MLMFARRIIFDGPDNLNHTLNGTLEYPLSDDIINKLEAISRKSEEKLKLI